MSNVKITSDGMPLGTRITTFDGIDITKHVVSVSWEHHGGKIPTARIELALFPVTLEGRVHYVAPDSRKIKSIVYEDETTLESDQEPT